MREGLFRSLLLYGAGGGYPNEERLAERRRTIVMGTRGSALALVQTGLVVERLRALQPGLAVETRVIKTSGDRGAVEAVGAFV